MCVNSNFENDKDVCFNYYNNTEFETNKFSKCNNIGCKYLDELEPLSSSNIKTKGICVHPEFYKDNVADINKICNYANTKKNSKEYCLSIGCKYKDKCYY